jgi:hypothetical protein
MTAPLLLIWHRWCRFFAFAAVRGCFRGGDRRRIDRHCQRAESSRPINPSPAFGQDGIAPGGLLLGALTPTIIMIGAFMFLP